jgi:outer membrane receptor for ferrienterochelin and colicins
MTYILRQTALALAVSGIGYGYGPAVAQSVEPEPPAIDDAHDDHDDHYHDHEGDSEHDHDDHDHDKTLDTVIVQATRSGRAVNDLPIRVEVIGQEEIEEKAIMRPGNISMLLAETGGVRVQTTSPALGAANIRFQGPYGRYTQLLSDGLPLYGGQAA